MKIHMEDRASAEKWLADVRALNEKAEKAVTDAGQAVTDIQTMADGTLIDELVEGGAKLMKVAEGLSKTMSGFTSMVRSVLEMGEDFVKNGKSYIERAFKAIL